MAVFFSFVETELAAKHYRANHAILKTTTQHTFWPLSLLGRKELHYKLNSSQPWMSALPVLQSWYRMPSTLAGLPGVYLLPWSRTNQNKENIKPAENNLKKEESSHNCYKSNTLFVLKRSQWKYCSNATKPNTTNEELNIIYEDQQRTWIKNEKGIFVKKQTCYIDYTHPTFFYNAFPVSTTRLNYLKWNVNQCCQLNHCLWSTWCQWAAMAIKARKYFWQDLNELQLKLAIL